jgi:tRNA A37 methylthiotransferase MiaB
VVSGCLPKIAPARLAQVFQGPIIDPRTFAGMEAVFKDPPGRVRRSAAPVRKEFHYVTEDSFVIMTATGCRHRCSFCAIKNAVGPLRSRPIATIVQEARQGLRAGYRNIRLIADDNGSYGLDIQTDLIELLEKLLRIPGDFKIEVWQFNPWGLIRMLPRLLPLLATGRFWGLRSQLQSGNDQVLRWMNRPYRAADFKSCIRAIRRASPKTKLFTTVIAGFPGESEAAFQDTVKIILDLTFDAVMVYAFSEMPGTTVPPGLKRVPEPVIAERVARLEQIKWLGHPDILDMLRGQAAPKRSRAPRANP